MHGLLKSVPQSMARRDAMDLTPDLPRRFQFPQIHRDRGRPFHRLLHQLIDTNPSRDTPRPSLTGAGFRSSEESPEGPSEGSESPVYVKDQTGHSSIQVTVDLYGHMIPGGNKQAVDRLDTPVLQPNSATSAQPAATFTGPKSSDLLIPQEVMMRGDGMDDGFRIRTNRMSVDGLDVWCTMFL